MFTAQQLSDIGVYNFNLSEYGKLKTVGTTDMWSSCCCCGKANLKKVVVMQDSEQNYSFFGTTCAYNASRGYAASQNRTRKVHPQVMEEILATLSPVAPKVEAVDPKEAAIQNAMTTKGLSKDMAVNLLVKSDGDLEKFNRFLLMLD
jgi:hypothetical protein